MFNTTRTAAGAAPLSFALAPAPGGHGLRGVAGALRHAMLHASQPPQHSGISPLVWKMSPPEHRAQLLRQHHLGSVFQHRRGWFSKLHIALQGAASQAPAASGQARPALGLWRHHGFFRAAPHAGGTLGHTIHHGGLNKLPVAAPAAAAAAAPAAAPTAATPEAGALAGITQQFQARFAQSAKDPAAFNALLKQAFGEHFDAAKAEGIRQQSLAGDFSWMPKIKLADGSQMRDLSGTQAQGEALGCYVKSEDTVLINRELLARDPAQAEKILAEEIGHALDARLNTSDAAGDEGDIFSKLVHGETISATDLAAMKADNDHGVIEINGKKEEVEYGWFKKLRKAISGGLKKVVKAVTNGIKQSIKAAVHVAQGLVTLNFNKVREGLQEGIDAVKDTAKAVVKAVKDTAKAVVKIVKDAVIKLMQSKIFNAILMVCRFIPIPIVALVVQIIDVVKAAYTLYQAVKYKSLSMALSAVASLATAGAGVAGNLGFAGAASTLKTTASWANNASMAYNVVAKKDLGSALGLLAGAGKTSFQQFAQDARQLNTVVQAVRSGDALSAIGAGLDMAAGDDKTGALHDAAQGVQGAQALKALHEGRYDSAQSLAGGMDGARQASEQAHAIAAQEREAAQAVAQAGTDGGGVGSADPGVSPPADPKAKLREMEQDFRQSTDEGASSVSYLKQDQGLYGTALRASGGNAQDALVLLGMWKQDGLTLNENGSPVVKDGERLRYKDVSQLPAEERQALRRDGAQVLRTNSVTLERNREAQATARAQADAANKPTPNSGEPVWSFMEASKAQRKADDARDAQAARAQGGGSPGADMTAWDGKSQVPQQRSTYDKISTATHVGLAGLGMIPAVGVLADVVDLALTAAEMPFGKSSKTDLGLSVAAIGASIVPGADQAADGAKIASRLEGAADGVRALAEPVYKTTKEAKAAADGLGFTKINETVHDGQAVFRRGKDFITRDLDGHNGGAWKMADSVKNLGSKETRSGTFDVNLKRIGD